MSEKKGVRRSVAIAFGIVSIVLAVSLVGVFAYYVPIINDKNNTIGEKDLTISEKNNMIDELNGQISQLNTNATNLQNQINSLNLRVTNLQNQVNNLTNILNLNESMIWVSDETLDLMVGVPYQENAPYAGYVIAEVSSSQSNETIVMFRYSSHGVNYDNRISVGSAGTAIFPVLPSSNILIFFANPNPQYIDISQYATVTITYYY
jgi:uncharacterized coiled-coil protein SlyX